MEGLNAQEKHTNACSLGVPAINIRDTTRIYQEREKETNPNKNIKRSVKENKERRDNLW